MKKYYSITFNIYNIIVISKPTSTSILRKALMSGALPIVFNDLFFCSFIPLMIAKQAFSINCVPGWGVRYGQNILLFTC